MACSISSYDSGRPLAADILGDSKGSLFNYSNSDDIYEHDNVNVVYRNDRFTADNGTLTASGKIGTASVSVHLKNNSTVASNNRTTYQQIQTKLSAYDKKNGTSFSNAFGWNFALSKMMGRPITKVAVIDFLDKQLPTQKSKAAEPKKTSILGRLFGNWSSSTPANQVRTSVGTAGAAWSKAPEGAGTIRSSTTGVNKPGQVAAKTTKELKPSFLSLSDRISDGGIWPFRSFEAFKNQKSNNLKEDEKQVVEMLDQHAQKNPVFLEKLNRCFSGESSEEIELPWGETGWKSSVANELQGLYEEAQKGGGILSKLGVRNNQPQTPSGTSRSALPKWLAESDA